MKPVTPSFDTPATVADVAHAAGVGIGTVSRVLNGSSQVRPGTRTKVLAAVEELGYRRLRSATQNSEREHYVGVVVPFFEEPSVYQRLKGMINTVQNGGHRLVVHNVSRPDEARALLTELPRSRTIDGLIVLSLPLRSDEGDRLANARFPTVLLDTWHSSLSGVTIDDVAGGRMATEHMLQLGHRRVGFVGEPPRNPLWFVSSRLREEGYRSALADAGMLVRESYIKHGVHLRSAARQLATELLALAEPPTAIVAASDIQALGVIDAAEASGRRVPDDLSVIGYDDIDIASYVGLSTVRQPLELSGQRAAEMLFGAMATPTSRPYVEQLPLEVLVRRTSAAPAEVRRARSTH